MILDLSTVRILSALTLHSFDICLLSIYYVPCTALGKPYFIIGMHALGDRLDNGDQRAEIRSYILKLPVKGTER